MDDPKARARLQLQQILQSHKAGDRDRTERLCRTFLQQGAEHWAVHAILGTVLLRKGHAQAAVGSLRRSLEINPDEANTWFQLGNAHLGLEDLTHAIDSYERSVALQPDRAEVHHNLGTAHEQAGQPRQAIDCFRRAQELRSDLVEPAICLGNVLQEVEAFGEALAAYDRALAIQPEDPRARRNRGALLLLTGDYVRGWSGREARFVEKPGLLHQPELIGKLPLWDGISEVEGELVLVTEQGFGDTFQFVRYGSCLRRRGIRVSLVAEAKLHGLLTPAELFDRLHPLPVDPATLPAGSQWLPLMSLPHRLQVTPDTARPGPEPYLFARPERVRHWQRRLRADAAKGGEQELLVGIHWQGNALHEQTSNRNRSLPLEWFAPVAALPGIRLVSLQKGPGAEQLESCSFRDRFVSVQEEVDKAWDFLETAAIVKACDLVVSNDSAVVHLAGALGHPAWLLLKKVPEWRWGLEGTATHWYRSLRLFRQRRSGDWPEVLQRVAASLSTFPPRADP